MEGWFSFVPCRFQNETFFIVYKFLNILFEYCFSDTSISFLNSVTLCILIYDSVALAANTAQDCRDITLASEDSCFREQGSVQHLAAL